MFNPYLTKHQLNHQFPKIGPAKSAMFEAHQLRLQWRPTRFPGQVATAPTGLQSAGRHRLGKTEGLVLRRAKGEGIISAVGVRGALQGGPGHDLLLNREISMGVSRHHRKMRFETVDLGGPPVHTPAYMVQTCTNSL